ncbi:hypothetical protein PR048_019251 [Dryococelus australis]|uniref:Uncharacterized protein n=1 Tax=Dryococelus australis TaxID=614101 RepID=A0ABQ9H2Z3_9NEOP|nr:hypothetical protein PR048_019251 [Dryococelus australis]
MPATAFTCPLLSEVFVVVSGQWKPTQWHACHQSSPQQTALNRRRRQVHIRCSSPLSSQHCGRGCSVRYGHADEMSIIPCCSHIAWSSTHSSLRMTLFYPLVPHTPFRTIVPIEKLKLLCHINGGVVVRLIASHHGELGLNPIRFTPDFPTRYRWSAGFSRGSPVYPAPSFRRCSIATSPHFTLIGSQDLAVRSHPDLFTRSLNSQILYTSSATAGYRLCDGRTSRNPNPPRHSSARWEPDDTPRAPKASSFFTDQHAVERPASTHDNAVVGAGELWQMTKYNENIDISASRGTLDNGTRPVERAGSLGAGERNDLTMTRGSGNGGPVLHVCALEAHVAYCARCISQVRPSAPGSPSSDLSYVAGKVSVTPSSVREEPSNEVQTSASMPRRQRVQYQHVSEFERGRMIGLRERRLSYRDISARKGHAATTVMLRDDCHFVRMAMTYRTALSTVLALNCSNAMGVDLSASTVRRHCSRLDWWHACHYAGFHCPETTNTSDCYWHLNDVAGVLGGKIDGRIRVRRCRDDRNLAACIVERHSGQTPSMMVWGAIGYNMRSRFLRIEGYLNIKRYNRNVLEPEQENARSHVARNVQDFYNERRVPMLPWPARSPDMSSIEHIWDMVGRQLVLHGPLPTTVEGLWTRIQTAWREIPQEDIQRAGNGTSSVPCAVLAPKSVSFVGSVVVELDQCQQTYVIRNDMVFHHKSLVFITTAETSTRAVFSKQAEWVPFLCGAEAYDLSTIITMTETFLLSGYRRPDIPLLLDLLSATACRGKTTSSALRWPIWGALFNVFDPDYRPGREDFCKSLRTAITAIPPVSWFNMGQITARPSVKAIFRGGEIHRHRYCPFDGLFKTQIRPALRNRDPVREGNFFPQLRVIGRSYGVRCGGRLTAQVAIMSVLYAPDIVALEFPSPRGILACLAHRDDEECDVRCGVDLSASGFYNLDKLVRLMKYDELRRSAQQASWDVHLGRRHMEKDALRHYTLPSYRRRIKQHGLIPWLVKGGSCSPGFGQCESRLRQLALRITAHRRSWTSDNFGEDSFSVFELKGPGSGSRGNAVVLRLKSPSRLECGALVARLPQSRRSHLIRCSSSGATAAGIHLRRGHRPRGRQMKQNDTHAHTGPGLRGMRGGAPQRLCLTRGRSYFNSLPSPPQGCWPIKRELSACLSPPLPPPPLTVAAIFAFRPQKCSLYCEQPLFNSILEPVGHVQAIRFPLFAPKVTRMRLQDNHIKVATGLENLGNREMSGNLNTGNCNRFKDIGKSVGIMGILGMFASWPAAGPGLLVATKCSNHVALHSGPAPYSPDFTVIGSQDSGVRSRPNLFTHSLR